MLLKRLVFGLAILFLALTSAAADLARPAGLEPDIRFWTQIFTEVTSQQVLIHDNRRLDIVYARLDLPNAAAPTARNGISWIGRERSTRPFSRHWPAASVTA